MPGYYPYECMAGDTFDAIAIDFYDTPFYADKLIEANPDNRKTLIFQGGEKLKIPVIQESPADTLPPWKRGVG